jgi:transposase
VAPPARPDPDQIGCGWDVSWEVSSAGSVVRAHQHAGEARKRGRGVIRRGALAQPGELTTKRYLACDGAGRPLAVVLTPSAAARQHPARPGARRDPGAAPGSPDRRHEVPLCAADDWYARGVRPTIPERVDQRARRASTPGRKPIHCKETSRQRNVIERGINRLTQWLGIATRFKQRGANYRAMVVVASLMIWLCHRFVRRALVDTDHNSILCFFFSNIFSK